MSKAGTVQQLGKLGVDACALWGEAASVIWLRSAVMLGGGPQACAEARLMVSEKIDAHRELAEELASGRMGWTPLSLGAGVTRFYLKGVRANRVRLMKRR